MMKRTMSIGVMALGVLALVSSAAFAERPEAGKCPMMQHGMTGCSKGHDGMFFHKAHFILSKSSELGLSDEQKKKIETLEYNLKKSAISNEAELKSLDVDIGQALRNDALDANAVNSLIDKKYALKAKKAKEDIQACANLTAILTPDQSKKLKEMRPMGKEKMFGHDRMETQGGWHKGSGAKAEESHP